MRRLIFLLLIAVVFGSVSRSAFAWGTDGHAIVAAIAERRLSPEARQVTRSMLDDASLASISMWADDIRPSRRETSRWHFINFAEGSTGYVPSRDCAYVEGQGDCIIAAIARAIAELKGQGGGTVESLKFLVHFVADVHQPFHAVGYERGGNGIRVTMFGNRMNLHAAWDTALVRRAGRTPEAYATYLEKEWLQGKDVEALARGEVSDWALASRALGETALVPQESPLSAEYYEKAAPVIDQQLALAGIRLARILNEIFR